MGVQWFPGHMAKAMRLIRENMDKTDVVIEILDARIPFSSRNPMAEKIVEKKPLLIVLNKADIADRVILDEWQEYFRKDGLNRESIAVSAATGKNISSIAGKCRELCSSFEWYGKRAVRAMIIGVPNTGKSAILNRIAGKRKQEVSNRPGVTREMKKIRVTDNFHLIDTPGVLWHKFEDQKTGEKLAILGSVRDSILYSEDIALSALSIFREMYPERLAERYRVGMEEVGEIGPEGLMQLIGEKRGCLVRGGIVDMEKVSRIILNDIREGRMGGICLERPDRPDSD